MRMTRFAVLPVLASAALALSACGGDEEPSSPATSEAGPTSASQEMPSSSASEAAPVDAGEKTAPGTKLKVGERAIIPWDKGTAAITVTAVEPGDKAEMGQKYGERAQGLTPYYIRFTVENVDGQDHAHASAPNFNLAMADGRGSGVVITGSLGTCKSESAPKDFTTAGAKFESCKLSAAQDGAEVAGAEYSQDDYKDESLIWTK